MARRVLWLLPFLLAACSPNPQHPPTATDHRYTLDEDNVLNVHAPGVLANDRDPEGDPLTVAGHTHPAHGTLALHPDGSFRYTPNANYNGTYAFAYTASDGHGHTATATVTLTVNPVQDPPTASLAAHPTAGTAPLTVSFQVAANDPDDDPLACTLDFGDGTPPASQCNGPVNHTYQNPGTFTATLTVDDGHTNPVTQTATVSVSSGSTSGFDIQLVYVDPPSDPAVRQAFEDAAARWSQVITGDLPDVQANIPANACGNPSAYQGTVDDLVIFVSVANIDGQGGVLGQAGPCYLRNASYLPFAGTMQFDAADLDWMKNNGTLEKVILHEMGHVLGLGTLWDSYFNLLDYDASSCQNSTVITYHGSGAVTAWQALGGSGQVPVEESGGAGTKCGHWREATFGDELMTGWTRSGDRAPLSKVTVGGLADLGYAVDAAAADPYQLPSGATPQGVGFEIKEILLRPRLP